MDRFSVDQIDRQLGAWLREEAQTGAPAGLVEDVFATTTRTRQSRSWWPPRTELLETLTGRRDRSARARDSELGWGRPARARSAWRGAPALTGAAAMVLVAVLIGLALRQPGIGPGATPVLSLPPASTPPSPPSGSGPSPSPTIASSPQPTILGTLSTRRLSLGPDAAPIGVTEAFGSIWVANIHAGDVRRFDPVTMRELARIPVTGAAWFAVADDALWVTHQTGTGLSRIDPDTNTVVAQVGDVPPCGAPVVALGSLWQAACDGGVILRIDPVRNLVAETFPLDGHLFLTNVGDRLMSIGSDGLAVFDPDTGAFTTIGTGPPVAVAAAVDFLTSDGTTLWLKRIDSGVLRVDAITGRTLADFAAPQAVAMAFGNGRAWLTVGRRGVLDVDLATNRVTRTIPLVPSPMIPFEADGVLWVTDFEQSLLWRIDL
jgi:DNA-binding beta-propeller fold protein YncE